MSVRSGPTAQVTKSAGASRVYVWDWTDDIGAAEIAGSTWTITGDGALTKDNESIVTGNKKTQVRLIGGTLNTVYTVVNTITTNGSPAEIEPATVKVRIAVE